MGAAEVVQFLGFLTNDRHVSVNTQKLALNALAFLYNTYLELPLGDLGFQHANKPARLPVVISSQEVGRVLAVMNSRDRLIFSLLFGSGLRISECLRLRIKDFDFSRQALTVHSGKGDKDRVTILSPSLRANIEAAMANAVEIQKMDNAQGVGPSLPGALGRKYPNAFRQPAWMFIFPSSGICNHPVTGNVCRHHLHDSVPRKALKKHYRKQVLLTSELIAIPSATVLRQSYCVLAAIFAPFRSYWGTQMLQLPRFILM